MPRPQELLLGEFRRTLDDRYRVAVPDEFRELLRLENEQCVLAKERVGCISLWHPETWQAKVKIDIDMAREKVLAGRWEKEIGQVQLLGRLLSTRHETTQLREGGRVLVPVSFRDFLGVHPERIDENDKTTKKGKPVMVIGAAVCIEIWNPPEWLKYQQGRMPKFRRLVQKLS